jgi:hypothetical protein
MSNFVTLFDETIRQSTQSDVDKKFIDKEFIKIKLIKGKYYKLYIKIKYINLISRHIAATKYIKSYVILFDEIIGLEYNEQNVITLKTLINSNIEEHNIYEMLNIIERGIRKQELYMDIINWDITMKNMLIELNHKLIKVFNKIISQQMSKDTINSLDIANEI